MKKILFEQLGNSITVVILTLAMIQSINNSIIKEDDFSIIFGSVWGIFVVWMIIFGIIRYIYSRKDKGYDRKKGELSFQDEREKMIGKKSTKITYGVVIATLLIFLIFFFFFSSFILDIKLLKVVTISLFGINIIIAYMTYLISWLILDYKY